eukprot:tig00020571_g11500.t1
MATPSNPIPSLGQLPPQAMALRARMLPELARITDHLYPLLPSRPWSPTTNTLSVPHWSSFEEWTACYFTIFHSFHASPGPISAATWDSIADCARCRSLQAPATSVTLQLLNPDICIVSARPYQATRALRAGAEATTQRLLELACGSGVDSFDNLDIDFVRPHSHHGPCFGRRRSPREAAETSSFVLENATALTDELEAGARLTRWARAASSHLFSDDLFWGDFADPADVPEPDIALPLSPLSALLSSPAHPYAIIRLYTVGEPAPIDALAGLLRILADRRAPLDQPPSPGYHTLLEEARTAAFLELRQWSGRYLPELGVSEIAALVPLETARSLFHASLPLSYQATKAAILASSAGQPALLLHHPLSTHIERHDLIFLVLRLSDLDLPAPDPETLRRTLQALLVGPPGTLAALRPLGLLCTSSLAILAVPSILYDQLPPPAPYADHPPTPITALLRPIPRAAPYYQTPSPSLAAWELFRSDRPTYTPLSPAAIQQTTCQRCVSTPAFLASAAWLHSTRQCPLHP